MLTGFSSNLSFTAYPPSPFYGMKPPLKLSVTSFMTPLMKPLTQPAPSKLLNLFINYPGGTPPWINQGGMPTGLIFTIARTLLTITKPYSNVLDALTSASAGKLEEKAGSNLSLALTRKKMLLYSPRLCNTKLTLTP
jgi:hypothetical protein